MASEGHILTTYNSNENYQSEPDDNNVDDALEKLTNSLRGAEYAIPVTHGKPSVWRRCKFQSHASPAQFPRDVQYVIDKLRGEAPWSKGRYHPCAYRLSSGDPMIQTIGLEGTRDGTTATNAESNPNHLLEGCGDGGDPGVGDKLLDLLRKWDIQNVVLCVTCWDDGQRGRLGTGRFRFYLDSAKAVLEQCYMDSVSVVGSSTAGSSTAGSSTAGLSTAGSSTAGLSSADGNSRMELVDERREDRKQRTTHSTKNNSKVVPRGADLHRMYQEARNRFMPVRDEFQGMSHSVVDADSQNFPEGEPDGMGNFGKPTKMGRVNHFLAVAPEINTTSNNDDHYPNMPSPPMAHHLPPIPLPSMTRNQLDEMKSIIRPHELIHRVFRCVAMLLGYQDTTWAGCRAMICSKHFIRELVLLQPMSIPLDEIILIQEILTELGPNFNPGNVQRQSILAADMLEWCIKVVRTHFVATAQSRMTYQSGGGSGGSGGRGGRGGSGGSRRYTVDEGEEEDYYYQEDNDEEGKGRPNSEEGRRRSRRQQSKEGDEEDEDDYGSRMMMGSEEHHQQEHQPQPENVTYMRGVPKKSLAIRLMMMDPNPDWGGQPKAKSPITVPYHMRNDVGPQPVRNVFKNAAKDYLGTGSQGSRGATGNTTHRTERSSIAGWNKSRGSTRATYSSRNSRGGMGSNNGVVPVNKW